MKDILNLILLGLAIFSFIVFDRQLSAIKKEKKQMVDTVLFLFLQDMMRLGNNEKLKKNRVMQFVTQIKNEKQILSRMGHMNGPYAKVLNEVQLLCKEKPPRYEERAVALLTSQKDWNWSKDWEQI